MCAPDVEQLLRVPVAASDSSFFLWLSLAACRGVGQRIFVWFEDVEWVWAVRGVRGDLSLSPPPCHVPSILITNITNLAQGSSLNCTGSLDLSQACGDKSARSLPPLLSLPLFSSQLGSLVPLRLLLLLWFANTGIISELGGYQVRFSSWAGTGVSSPTRSSRGDFREWDSHHHPY